MDNKEFKYDAFISYRHCELDKFVAVKLHRILETYKLPKSLQKKLGIKRRNFRRVFRDQEELPLTSNLEDPIIDALNNSKYLIVICTPRLKDSLWCKKEIETFKKIRGRKNVFCVLAEGEPSESFPEEVLYDEVETTRNGKKVKEKVMVEPLAADVRGKNKKQVLKKLKTEKLRLIAPMYNLDYDDLRQRHKIWRQKKIIHTSLLIALLSVLFAVYSIAMFIKIEMQQNVLAEKQALSLVFQAKQSLDNDDRYEAVNLSYQALTDFEDIVMPYTPDAEYSLVESLGVYDVGITYKAVGNIKTDGIISAIKTSPDLKHGAVYDGSDTITLFNTENLKKIAKYDIPNFYIDENSFSFIGNDTFAYINSKGNVVLVNAKSGKKITEIKNNDISFKALKGDILGNNLAYTDYNKLYIYNLEDKKVIFTLDNKDDFMKNIFITKDGKYVFAQTNYKENKFDINAKETMTIHVIDVDNLKEINNVTFDVGYISGIVTIDNNAYILMNDMRIDYYKELVVSYDYINNNVNWTYETDSWGNYINRTYNENYIAAVHGNVVDVIDSSTGNLVNSFSTSSEIIDIYSYSNSDILLVFSTDGHVNTINMKYQNNIYQPGKYEFNASPYLDVDLSETGFILIPENDNRIVLYEKKANEDVKEEDISLDYVKDDSIESAKYDEIKEKFKLNNKSLVKKIFTDTKKRVLFVNYTNGDTVIYDYKSKKLLKKLDSIGNVYHYFGKDKYGRIYIGDSSYSYILDKDYNLVGRVLCLAKLEKNKLIINDNGTYYSIKIYTIDELKTMAKDYLKENK